MEIAQRVSTDPPTLTVLRTAMLLSEVQQRVAFGSQQLFGIQGMYKHTELRFVIRHTHRFSLLRLLHSQGECSKVKFLRVL